MFGGLELAAGVQTSNLGKADRYVMAFTAGVALWNMGAAYVGGLVNSGGRLGGKIRRAPNPAAYRRALHWHKTAKNVRAQGATFLRKHRSEDLETALKALEIAAGSFKEVTEHYE